MLLTYNIVPQKQETYLRFMLNEFIPTLQRLGLQNTGVWHTAYGNYPIRLVVFATESTRAMQNALEGDTWNKMELKLMDLVSDYARRIVPNDSRFQF